MTRLLFFLLLIPHFTGSRADSPTFSATHIWAQEIPAMSFMQHEIVYDQFWKVATTCGDELVPSELVGDSPELSDFSDYLEGEPYEDEEPELKKGWYCRLTALGYMDCIEWSGPYDSEESAREFLEEMYGE